MTEEDKPNVVQLNVEPRTFNRTYRGHRIDIQYNRKKERFEWRFVHSASVNLVGTGETAMDAEVDAKKEIDRVIDGSDGAA